MSKKHKQNRRNQQVSRGSTPPSAPAKSTPPPAQPAATSADTQQQVEDLALEAELALEAAGIPEAPAVPESVPAGRSLEELKRDAEGARLRFAAALKACELKQRAAEEAKARADDAEKREAERTATLDQREKQLDGRDERITARELDAEADFRALRKTHLQPLQDERSALQTELARLSAESSETRARLDAEYRQRIEERERQWQQAADQRALDEEAQRRALDAAMANARTSLLADARRQADEVIARSTQEAEAQTAALDARDASLRERERALRSARDEIAAKRELLDEDRELFDQRVVRHAGTALAEQTERARTLEEDRDRARRERDALHARVRAFEDLERRLDGRSPEEVLRDLEAAHKESARLRDELASRPTEAERLRLVELERELTRRADAERGLRAEVASLTTRLSHREIAAVELETLRAHKESLEASLALLRTAHDELRAEVDSLTRKDDEKNPMAALLELDRASSAKCPAAQSLAPTSLGEFADDLRRRITHALEDRELHYSARDVRAFLGGMAMTPLLLLQGISGTGKTSLPKAVANAVGGDHAVIEVQAGWRDRQDLLGYYNAFHRHFYASNFLQALYRAGTEACRDRVTLIVLDEINLSRVEQFFADFLSVMEQSESERRVTLMSDPVANPPALLVEGRHLPIPRNVWFVGTANHDETTTAFADKTYDRAHIMELPRHPSANGAVTPPLPKRAPVSCDALRGLFATAMTARAAEVKQTRAWFDDKGGIGRLLEKEFRLSWGNRLERDIDRYVPVVCEAGGTVGEAVDHLLHTKLLRKLRDRHDVRAHGLELLRDHLATSWLDSKCGAECSLELVEHELRARRAGDLS